MSLESFKEGFAPGTDGTTLYYERGGDGPALLLCDGLLCEGHIWKYFVPAMSADWECLHWHYPGHGRSHDPPVGSTLNPERLADDAAAIVRHSKLSSVTVVGHSMGVQVALEIFNRHRSLVNGLVLICGSPGRLVEGFHESAILGYMVPMLDLATKFVPGQMAKLWKSLPAGAMLKAATRSSEVDRRLIKTTDLAEYLSRMNQVDFRVALNMLEGAGRHDAAPYLKSIDVPVMIVAGRKDTFTPADRSSVMASMINGAEVMMVSNGTHSLPIEQPDLVNLRIRRFLRDRVRD